VYAIVDIETTGGNAKTGSITEIAIVITDGKAILDRYETLVNPMQPIPLFIQNLTGITDEMVENAPVFSQVAEVIFELLRDKIFVAHNVNFDYSFVAHQLSQHGFKLQLGKLCTVRLSRKIFTDLPSYSLGNLCRSLGIKISNRHRASGDAFATADLFRMCIEYDKERHIESMLKKGSRESYLPMHLDTSDLDSMPNTPGVYYFHDIKGKIVYVGKAKRLKKRVISHFSNNSVNKRKQDMLRIVTRISYRECGNELMASVYESIEIKRIWPLFNRSQKKFEHRFGICSYIDQRGVKRLTVLKKKKNIQLHIAFPMQIDGIRMLHQLAREHGLCPKMCFLQDEKVDCTGVEENFCMGICSNERHALKYNQRVDKAIHKLISEEPALVVFGKGRSEEELSCIMIDKHDFLASGFIPVKTRKNSPEKIKALLEQSASNEFVKSMIIKHAALNSDDVKMISKSAKR
jgi:DNA polymerase-3 subunit epsilon